ncbi:MAG TPA: CHAT domain-containing protein, partial [Armatimonadota bacterium]|nr:CHAT domain-containing protein [Armatimonadota bacterium]
MNPHQPSQKQIDSDPAAPAHCEPAGAPLSERDACAAIRGHVLRGAYAEAALFGDALSADLRARPGIALALARARILQGRFNEANTALEAADSAMAEPGERLILALEAAALRLYWDMAVTEALAAAGAALASADPEAGLADRAEAERIHARILLIAATYREIPAIVGQRARARLPEVAEVLERAGRPDEALAARMTWAERTGELVARRAALADVASRALDANRPAVAAQARLAQAEQMLNAGASSEALSAELDTASSLFAEARHVHGPIDVQRLRALIRVEREYAGLEELDACLAAYRRIDYPSGEMGLLVNLSQLALERGDTPAAADYRLRGLELADATGMGFARDNLLLAQIDLLMRTADYSSAIELGQAILATPVPAFQAASSEHLLATAYAFVQDYPPALTHGRGAIARFEAIGAEESASLTALQLANSLDSTRDEPTWKEAVTLLTEWIGRDTQRGDLAAAASKQELLAQIHLNRYYYSPTRHGDATLLAEVEQLLAAGEQLAATLSGREAARRHGALHQLRGQLLTARHAPEEAEQEWRAALAVYQAAGLEMEAAGCWDIIGVMRLNRANQELIPHFGEAETALAHALEYYSRAVMRDRSADTRFMLARLYVNASPRVAPDLGGRLLDEALRLLSEAEADYDLLRREFAGPVLSAQTAKRTLVRRSRRIYDLALEIQVWRRDADAAWSWCQRAKARALSDALGTSSSPPARVMAALEAHAGSL